MNKTLILLLVAALTLTACNSWRESRVNPSNWFGGSTEAPPPADVETNALLPPQREGLGLFDRPEEEDISVPIATVTELRVDSTPTGAIVVATGVAARQGAFAPVLRRDPDAGDGVLAYTFRVDYPEGPTPLGSERSRTVSQAVNVSAEDLAGIRVVRVSGLQNAREARR